MKTISKNVEELLEKPYQVIDILPERVPEEAPGRYFAVERYYLEPARFMDIRKRFADIILKLYCYYDLSVLLGMRTNPRSIRNRNSLRTGSNRQNSICVSSLEMIRC